MLYIPMVNCGYCAGDCPECWDGEEFRTEKECEEWINDHYGEFTANEIGGGVYACRIK